MAVDEQVWDRVDVSVLDGDAEIVDVRVCEGLCEAVVDSETVCDGLRDAVADGVRELDGVKS